MTPLFAAAVYWHFPVLIVTVPSAPMASRAFKTRFISTCSICTGSVVIVGTPGSSRASSARRLGAF